MNKQTIKKSFLYIAGFFVFLFLINLGLVGIVYAACESSPGTSGPVTCPDGAVVSGIDDGETICNCHSGPAASYQAEHDLCSGHGGFLYCVTWTISPDLSCPGGFCSCISTSYGSCGTGNGGPHYDTCKVRNLSCPSQALVGSDFNMSWEFLGTEEPEPWEVRSIWGPKYWCLWIWCGIDDDAELWCEDDRDFTSGVWHTEVQTVKCPPQVGTWTYTAACDDEEDSNDGCGRNRQHDDEASCDVQCIAGSACNPDAQKNCCDGEASLWDQNEAQNKPNVTGSLSCDGASCWLTTASFPEQSPPNNNSRCCGDDTAEHFISGTSANSCDGTSACCNNAGDYVEGGQCVAACTSNQPPGKPILEPPTSLEGRLTAAPQAPENKSILEQLGANLLEILTFGFLKK